MVNKEWIEGLERQFKPQPIPPADVVANLIAKEYGDTLAYHAKMRKWMRYEADSPNEWSPETVFFMEHIVSTILDSKGIQGYGSHSYITNILRHLRPLLIVHNWTAPIANI